MQSNGGQGYTTLEEGRLGGGITGEGDTGRLIEESLVADCDHRKGLLKE